MHTLWKVIGVKETNEINFHRSSLDLFFFFFHSHKIRTFMEIFQAKVNMFLHESSSMAESENE